MHNTVYQTTTGFSLYMLKLQYALIMHLSKFCPTYPHAGNVGEYEGIWSSWKTISLTVGQNFSSNFHVIGSDKSKLKSSLIFSRLNSPALGGNFDLTPGLTPRFPTWRRWGKTSIGALLFSLETVSKYISQVSLFFFDSTSLWRSFCSFCTNNKPQHLASNALLRGYYLV